MLEENIFMYFLGCTGLSNNDIEMARGTLIQEIRPRACFQTGDFVKEKLGGLHHRTTPNTLTVSIRGDVTVLSMTATVNLVLGTHVCLVSFCH